MDLTSVSWRKATRSKSQGECVEVAFGLREVRPVRDSKNPGGAPLCFDAAVFAGFLAGVKEGRFDR